MERKAFNEVVSELEYVYVENTPEKDADAVAEEIRKQIRDFGWDCLEDGDSEEDWLEEHPEYNEEDCECSHVADVEFLCDNSYYERCGHDVDWCEFQITFYGKWSEYGVFEVTH